MHTRTGTYLDSTWTNNNYRADFEVDYMLAVRTSDGAVYLAKTSGGNVGAQFLGNASGTPTNNTAGSILPAGAATFALNNQTGNDIRTTHTGFEIRFTLSALGATAAGNVRIFAIISGANDPFFSNVFVPGTSAPGGAGNVGFNPNFNLLSSLPVGTLGPFNTGPLALPVELTSFSAQAINNGIRIAWTTASESNNAGFEVQRRSARYGIDSEGWQVLGFVKGKGTTAEAQSYSFIDRTASGLVQYRLKQVDFNGTFKYSPIIEVEAGLPQTFELSQNYPNPFNPATVISYQLPVASEVTLQVYDILGRAVATLVKAKQEAGRYQVQFNAGNLTSGLYFYRLQAGNFVQTRKMILMR
ncbi:MAG: T9SS type A sorting domain-containing protein [Chloroherpetonaceae bacterium]|nr:T9SS type A sorting domain-containing protein [Chloroherpetonaceae bacterium]